MNIELTPELEEILGKLQHKYASTGQDLTSYLEGLYLTKYLSYWDYIHLDILLSLQNPKTDIEDEEIFIVYHQITELHFKLILKEIYHLIHAKTVSLEDMKKRMKRAVRYFQALTHSFDIMSEGMDRDQFLAFRLALQPASGFQSAQYRKIEFLSAPIEHLLHLEQRGKQFETTEEYLNAVYWKYGGIQKDTGKPAHTNLEFDKKYQNEFVDLLNTYKNNTLWAAFLSLGSQADEELKELMRQYDTLVNVNWPLAHYKSAVKYLKSKETTIAATGGTNWTKYLPPRFQKRIFFPDLWSANAIEDWGKQWVDEALQNTP